MFNQLLDWDTSLFIFLNGLGTPYFDSLWMLITHKASNFIVYLFFSFYFFRLKGLKPTLFLLLSVGLLILFTDQITNIFKNGFERLRPCHNPEFQDVMRIVKKGCGGLYGYFSGHASNSFALATFFSCIFSIRFPKVKYILFLIASLVAYSRIYIGVHYPLDILSGILFGFLWALYFYKLCSKLYARIFPNTFFQL
tara:strand:+ start:4214 stop:4801 length:588 start_codon:yes stop_codon:yes gene_type:complete